MILLAIRDEEIIGMLPNLHLLTESCDISGNLPNLHTAIMMLVQFVAKRLKHGSVLVARHIPSSPAAVRHLFLSLMVSLDSTTHGSTLILGDDYFRHSSILPILNSLILLESCDNVQLYIR